MSKLVYVATFVAGTVIGGLATWLFLDKKYKDISKKEIDSVKEKFSRGWDLKKVDEKPKEEPEEEPKESEDPPVMDIKTYAQKILKDSGYVDYSTKIKAAEEPKSSEEPVVYDEPYIISFDEYGELYDYETINLIFYQDGVLADEEDEIVEDIKDTVGDALDHFAEHDDEALFVRNDKRKCDYEISRDYRRYSAVVGMDDTEE